MTSFHYGTLALTGSSPAWVCGCLDRELVWQTSVGRSNDMYVATSFSSPMTPSVSPSSYSMRILFP